MPLGTLTVAGAVTPTVIKTGISHYTNRKPRQRKPTAHIGYDEGLHLIRCFLNYASEHTVEELQSFTAQWNPHPRWVKVDNATIPTENVTAAAEAIISQLGPQGVERVGGAKWWQWRQKGGTELKGEWIEMRRHYNERKKHNEKGSRVILYVHGGGYYFGSVDEHRYQMQRHARKLKARVFAPRYRLAPQFPMPCGLQDCLAAYLYLLTQHAPSEILLSGDSAGGGMVLSMLCILRDQGLPLPAGATLISPWVDLTHSFPSLAGDDSLDYIPAHGFHQKPSPSWPPPNEDDMAAIAKGAYLSASRKRDAAETKGMETDAVRGFSVSKVSSNSKAEELGRRASAIPGPGHQVAVEINGKLITLKDQIQLYTTNQLISHPLASPVLQPSLGGLPPLLIMTGGGELLRDEQIYLAHKAANPAKYCLGDVYRSQYDPDDIALNKYKPTPVQLQVWDDLCHVTPTLSFTRPAKYMYRSIAQFGAWALARAQQTNIEIMDDDNISVISSGEDTDSESRNSTDSIARAKSSDTKTPKEVSGMIGKVGDPIPMFKNHMVRQRVDRHGCFFPLAPESELPATCMDRNEVGVVKPVPVMKWMARKKEWDGKFARVKRNVQKDRIKEYVSDRGAGFGPGENPPPSALAGRKGTDEGVKKKRKSMGLAIWSLWGSKHDENTLKREDEIDGRKLSASKSASQTATAESLVLGQEITRGIRKSNATTPLGDDNNSMSRRRTITVSDQGQTEGGKIDSDTEAKGLDGSTKQQEDISAEAESSASPHQTELLTPLFIPKFKSHLSHLREGSRDESSSIRTGYSGVVDNTDTASTTAVFAAPGVTREHKATNASSLFVGSIVDDDNFIRSEVSSMMNGQGQTRSVKTGHTAGGAETPGSRRSVERLMDNQVVPDAEKDEDGTRLQPLRSPSSVAVVDHEGVVGKMEYDMAPEGSGRILNENSISQKVVGGQGGAEEKRPGLYDRADSEFQTAMEKF